MVYNLRIFNECHIFHIRPKGDVSFLYLLQYMENNGNIPAFTCSSQIFIITI